MNILAIDTSTTRAAVAVASRLGEVREAPSEGGRQHGRTLMVGVRDALRGLGLSPRDLELIAVGLGPGSYTGLRIGLTAAKTLAYATGCPLVAFDSLEAIARNAPDDALFVSAVADAQRGDLYTADFSRPAPGAPLARESPTRVEPKVSWVERLPDGAYVLGPGLERARAELPPRLRAGSPDESWPRAEALLRLAREAHAAGDFADPWFLEPLYLRRSAAEDQWDALGKRGAG